MDMLDRQHIDREFYAISLRNIISIISDIDRRVGSVALQVDG